MSASSAISFFNTKPPLSPAERRAKDKAARKAANTKAEKAAIRAFLHADAPTRKQMLLDQAETERKAKLVARRKWRKAYQRQYRAMAAMATVFI
jgi:hypothetical protein